MATKAPVLDTSSAISGTETGDPILSTTPTGTPTITPGPLRPIRSTRLQLSIPTPAPTRHASVTQGAANYRIANANDMTAETSGLTANNRASSISAISDLTFTPSQLEYKDRSTDRFEPSSEEEDQSSKPFHIYENEGVEFSRGPSKRSEIMDNGSRNWNSVPPRTPVSPNTTEAPTSPRNAEGGEISLAGFGHPSKSGTSSPRRVTRVRGESINSGYGPGSPHCSSSTALNGERRGSEAKSWEEVHAARREAAAALKLADLTTPAQEIDHGTSQLYPSNSTRALKSTPLPITVGPMSDLALSRNSYASTRAIRSPHPEDDLATPTTAGVSQPPSAVSLSRYPSHSTKAMKSPNGSPTTPKSSKSVASTTSSKRAERSLHVPFLPNLLRLTSPRTSNDTARQENDDVAPVTSSNEASRRASASSSTGRKGSRSSSGASRRNSVPVTSGGEPLKSVFEADDSEEYDDDAEVSNATTAATGRPKIVRQRASGREVVGLKEILKEAPITVASNVQASAKNKSPTKSKISRLLGESVKIGGKRSGIVSVSAAKEAQDVTLSHMDPISVDATQGTPENCADGLRSNPVKRAATAPVKRPRKVTFPPPLDTAVGMQAEREMRDVRFSTRLLL